MRQESGSPPPSLPGVLCRFWVEADRPLHLHGRTRAQSPPPVGGHTKPTLRLTPGALREQGPDWGVPQLSRRHRSISEGRQNRHERRWHAPTCHKSHKLWTRPLRVRWGREALPGNLLQGPQEAAWLGWKHKGVTQKPQSSKTRPQGARTRGSPSVGSLTATRTWAPSPGRSQTQTGLEGTASSERKLLLGAFQQLSLSPQFPSNVKTSFEEQVACPAQGTRGSACLPAPGQQVPRGGSRDTCQEDAVSSQSS